MSVDVESSDAVILTRRGRERLESRLDRALDRAAELAKTIATGPEHGRDDVDEHLRLVKEIEDLARALGRATMVTDVDEDPQIVELGDEVDIEFEDGEVETFVLVHPVEASTDDASISVNSPLSQALLGHRPGDTVRVEAPAGTYTCTIRARRRAA